MHLILLLLLLLALAMDELEVGLRMIWIGNKVVVVHKERNTKLEILANDSEELFVSFYMFGETVSYNNRCREFDSLARLDCGSGTGLESNNKK